MTRSEQSASARPPPTASRCASAAAAPRTSTPTRWRASRWTCARTAAWWTTSRPSWSSPRARAPRSTEIDRALAGGGQMLACEPPRFGPEATLGGCVAAGFSGPRRAAAGSVRDFVLGVKVLDAKGEVLSFGGQVMKNVAGFDLSRLLTGSFGTLGVILEASLEGAAAPRRGGHAAVPDGRSAGDRDDEPLGRAASADLGDVLRGRRAERAPVRQLARRGGGAPQARRRARARGRCVLGVGPRAAARGVSVEARCGACRSNRPPRRCACRAAR